MAVTININNLSLCHKGSSGISTATVPDVCKTPTPGGPVPMPYPNISMSSDLENGTTTVTVDGGNMAAIKGSDFSRSTGDEPGTIGGVKSNVNMKASKWILYSMDVKFDGANACRLADKKTQNNENTIDAQGLLQIVLTQLPFDLVQIARECHAEIEKKHPGRTCTVKGTLKHTCCRDKVRALNNPAIQAEYQHPGIPNCRLDVAVLSPSPVPGMPATVSAIYDFKFNCTRPPKMSGRQLRKYNRIFKAPVSIVFP